MLYGLNLLEEIMTTSSTRRVVTGLNEQGESVLIADEAITSFVPYAICPFFQIEELFYTEDHPLSLLTRHVSCDYDINLPENTVRFMKIRMPTKTEIIQCLQAAGEPLPEDWTQFNLHRTDSIDYIYVLSGQNLCIVGDRQIPLKAGDFLAQIGPEHTWLNDHDEPCIILCIMFGLKASGARKEMPVR